MLVYCVEHEQDGECSHSFLLGQMNEADLPLAVSHSSAQSIDKR